MLWIVSDVHEVAACVSAKLACRPEALLVRVVENLTPFSYHALPVRARSGRDDVWGSGGLTPIEGAPKPQRVAVPRSLSCLFMELVPEE